MPEQYLSEIMAFHRRRAAAYMSRENYTERMNHILKKRALNFPMDFQFSKALRPKIEPENTGSASGSYSQAASSGQPTKGVISVIPEIKKQSPSKGAFLNNLDPITLAQEFKAAGASAISVLTDKKYFGGSLQDLRNVSEAVSLPLLQKDFTVCLLDIIDAHVAGASAVLLIMSALDDAEVKVLASGATKLGMDCVVEIHTEEELGRALTILNDLDDEQLPEKTKPIILVNQRDLNTFEEYPGRAVELANYIPPSFISIAASCVNSSGMVEGIEEAGYDAVLVGEYLMQSEDPANALRNLII